MALISFGIGLKYRKRHRELSHLYIYPVSSAIQCIIYVLYTLRSKTSLPIILSIHKSIINVSIYTFITIEVSCIFFFFYKTHVINKKTRKDLLIIYFACICFYVSCLLRFDLLEKNVVNIYSIESVVILTPCFIYLFQLFLKPPILNLLEEPSFWFNSGIFIYFILTLPLFLMINYFAGTSISRLVDIVNYIGYILIFSFLIRAYLCKPKTAI